MYIFLNNIIFHTAQQQHQQTNKQVVPHEVTCNPTDDTARDDELSNSFASNQRDNRHDAYCSINQNGQYHTNQDHQMQQSLQMHPMLPPITSNDLMDCQHHQINLLQSQVKRSCNGRNDESSQKASTEQMKQPPVVSFIKRKNDNDSTHKAMLRFFDGSLPSIDPDHIMVPNADRNAGNQSKVKITLYQFFFGCVTH